MATKYTVALNNGVVMAVEADGYRLKEGDGWVHFFKDGTYSESPKVTLASFPAPSIVWVGTEEKVTYATPNAGPVLAEFCGRLRQCIDEDVSLFPEAEGSVAWVAGMKNARNIVGMVQEGLR